MVLIQGPSFHINTEEGAEPAKVRILSNSSPRLVFIISLCWMLRPSIRFISTSDLRASLKLVHYVRGRRAAPGAGRRG